MKNAIHHMDKGGLTPKVVAANSKKLQFLDSAKVQWLVNWRGTQDLQRKTNVHDKICLERPRKERTVVPFEHIINILHLIINQ